MRRDVWKRPARDTSPAERESHFREKAGRKKRTRVPWRSRLSVFGLEQHSELRRDISAIAWRRYPESLRRFQRRKRGGEKRFNEPWPRKDSTGADINGTGVALYRHYRGCRSSDEKRVVTTRFFKELALGRDLTFVTERKNSARKTRKERCHRRLHREQRERSRRSKF